MTENELQFCLLCGPLADAMDMLDAGNIQGAKAVLGRVIRRAEELCAKERRSREAQER